MINPRIFLLLSGIAYTVPFIAPSSFWWLIFLFPPFLFLATDHNKLRWPDYLLWSLAMSTVHLFPIGDAIIRMTSAPLYLQLLPTIALILYVSLYPFAFLMSVHLFRYLPNTAHRLLVWSAGLWLYLLTVEYALFWVFGRVEGYVFMNPLLPLATIPSLQN